MSKVNLHKIKDRSFYYFGYTCTLLGILLLVIFIGDIAKIGWSRLSWEFFTSLPSRFPEESGIYTAMMGTIWVMVLTMLISFPIGIAAGIYLEEYGTKGYLSRLLEINISNLAGVPSVIYGLLGLEVFARIMNMHSSIMTGSLTLSLLILPMIIVATRESIKTVPQSIKDASYALGATKWQVISFQVLPASYGGIFTGVILALSRAVGEAAPLLVVGALAYVPFAPNSPMDVYSVLPIQIFNWISRPQQGFDINAAAAILVLLFITISMNGIALFLRHKWQKKMNW